MRCRYVGDDQNLAGHEVPCTIHAGVLKVKLQGSEDFSNALPSDWELIFDVSLMGNIARRAGELAAQNLQDLRLAHPEASDGPMKNASRADCVEALLFEEFENVASGEEAAPCNPRASKRVVSGAVAVPTGLSDIFFNLNHSESEIRDDKGVFIEYCSRSLLEEAELLLGNLSDMGLCYTGLQPADLVNDFSKRT